MTASKESYDESEMLQLLRHMDSNCMGDGWTESVLVKMESRLLFVSSCLENAPPCPTVGTLGNLLIFEGVGNTPHWRVLRGRTAIGSSPDCDLTLAENGVSRQHALISEQADGKVLVEDQGSTNGTFVNGYKVFSASLLDGDILTCGTTHLIFFRNVSREAFI